ncbi:GPDM-like protein [Mya arenaria]|uniref:glycerol-3-phosphate dehydrogenase n=1 Tax=Mya arenaria TaxID=6604 RepID=A0ABY7EQJ4_MYAAR|nr:GPDM-like protein [Mya arenaria]
MAGSFRKVSGILPKLGYTSVALGGGALLWTYMKPEEQRHVTAASEVEQKYAWAPLPTREQQLKSLATEEFDVLVVGGGATGTGVAFDAYRMVKEALDERANLIEIAPHLAYPFPIMLPVYKYWQVPYYWAGIKMYDFVAGKQRLKPSYFLSKKKAMELFPMLKRDKLVGALVYYDGQHDDARMCLSIAISTARFGGTIANYTELVELYRSKDADGNDVVTGARLKDRLTEKEFDVKAKCVVNATGPYTDSIRTMGSPQTPKICQPSSAPRTWDYWTPPPVMEELSSSCRTTDNACDLTFQPAPTEKEIQFILKEVRNYLHPDVEGGKWTTYRHMAEETVDRAIKECGLKPASGCRTKGLMLDGAHGWSPTMFIRLVQDFGIEMEVAKHLANTYGDKAFKVAKMATLTGKRWPVVGRRLHEEFPYLEAEVRYAIREYACTAIDIIGRRTRLAFCNVHAAEEALPRVIEIMAEELKWNKQKQKEQMERAKRFLRKEMGLDLGRVNQDEPVNLTKVEINDYIKRFRSLDKDNKGYITSIGERVSDDQLHEMLSEVDLNKNAQLMNYIKKGSVTNSRFAKAAELAEDVEKISVERSGGGV